MTRSRCCQFSVRTLLTLQFGVAPLFLAPAYADYKTHAYQFNPWTALLWLVVPPLVYALVLAAITLRRSKTSPSVFSGVCRGVWFGVLFGLLSWGPSGIPAILRDVGHFCAALRAWISNGYPPIPLRLVCEAAGQTLGEYLLLSAFWLVHYALFGAASGGVAAVLVQCFPSASHPSPTEDAGRADGVRGPK
jgi:hypothetical protein